MLKTVLFSLSTKFIVRSIEEIHIMPSISIKPHDTHMHIFMLFLNSLSIKVDLSCLR